MSKRKRSDGDEGERSGGRKKEKWIQPQDPLHSTEDETEGLYGAPEAFLFPISCLSGIDSSLHDPS